jgi:hypothetical protein
MNHELDELHHIRNEAKECLKDIQGIVGIARRRHSDWWVALEGWVEYQGLNHWQVDTNNMLWDIKECIAPIDGADRKLWEIFANARGLSPVEMVKLYNENSTKVYKCPHDLPYEVMKYYDKFPDDDRWWDTETSQGHPCRCKI